MHTDCRIHPVKDYLTYHILLRCDSLSDLYPVTKPSPSPTAFLSTSASTWHQLLRHPDDQLSCLLKEQLLEPALNLTVHCCGLEFRVLNGYDQKSFDEERGLN
ncbi:hypothetical protein Tco_1439221 [Tanacetum coccineum]